MLGEKPGSSPIGEGHRPGQTQNDLCVRCEKQNEAENGGMNNVGVNSE